MATTEAQFDQRRIEGLWLGRASGNPVERARAFGRSVREGRLPRDTQDFFAEIMDQYHDAYPAALRLAAKGFYSLLCNTRFVLKDGLFEEMLAFGEEAGISRGLILKGVVLPDVIACSLGGLKLLEPAMLQLGCSTFSRNFEDRFLTGRNLDFTGTGLWDRDPMVTIIHPEPGSRELAHLSIASSPLFFGSITGLNEAGILLTLHQTYTRELFGRGVPIYLVGEQVLRHARTLDEAVALLRDRRPGPLWIFNVSDLKSGRTISIEASSTRFEVREAENGCFAQANHLLATPAAVRDRLEAIPQTIAVNSRYRQRFGEQTIPGVRTPSDMAGLLAHRTHPRSCAPAPRDVQKSVTIQTVITESVAGEMTSLWVSVDPAPTAGGRFARLPIRELFDRDRPLDSIAIEIENLAGTSVEDRATQLRMVELFELWEKRRYEDVLKRLPAFPSNSDLVVQQLALYKLGRLQEMKPRLTETEPGLDRDDRLALLALELLSILKSADKSASQDRRRELILAIEELGPTDPAIRLLIQRARFNKKLGKLLSDPTYDWMGGGLCWRFGW